MSKAKRLIMVTGSARSGKSCFAEQWAKNSAGQVYFIATLEPHDQEMIERVEHHRQRRPGTWITVEEGLNPEDVIRRLDAPGGVFLLDCLTLLVTNWLLNPQARHDQIEILQRVDKLAKTARGAVADVLVVTNEVGGGIVPQDALSRNYRDILGQANQIMASYADEVYLMVSGMPIEIKGKGHGDIRSG